MYGIAISIQHVIYSYDDLRNSRLGNLIFSLLTDLLIKHLDKLLLVDY